MSKSPVDKISKSEEKVIRLLKDTIKTAESIRSHVTKEAHQLSSVLFKAGEALSTVDQDRRKMVLDTAGVSTDSSYRSTLNRIALDPDLFKEKYLETKSVNKAIALLPHQTTEEGKSKGGRPKESPKKKLEKKAMKAIDFLLANFELKDLIDAIKSRHEQLAEVQAKADKKAKVEDEEEEV